jgi:hypothetical protein
MPGALSAMAIPSVYPCLPMSMPIAIPSDTDYDAVRMGAEVSCAFGKRFMSSVRQPSTIVPRPLSPRLPSSLQLARPVTPPETANPHLRPIRHMV